MDFLENPEIPGIIQAVWGENGRQVRNKVCVIADFIFEYYLGRTVLRGARYEWCMISLASDVWPSGCTLYLSRHSEWQLVFVVPC